MEDMEPMPPMVCVSVGFLLDDGVEFKTLAMTVNTTETQVLARLTIPVCAITRVRKLK